MPRGACKFPIPCPQCLVHAFAGCHQFGDLLIDRMKHPLSRCAHVAARLPAGLAHQQESGDLAERESKLLRISNQREPPDHRLRILPIARGRSRWFRQEAEPFVVPDGVGRDTGQCGNLTDRQDVTHRSMIIGA